MLSVPFSIAHDARARKEAETLIAQRWKFVGMIGSEVVLEEASARAQG